MLSIATILEITFGILGIFFFLIMKFFLDAEGKTFWIGLLSSIFLLLFGLQPYHFAWEPEKEQTGILYAKNYVQFPFGEKHIYGITLKGETDQSKLCTKELSPILEEALHEGQKVTVTTSSRFGFYNQYSECKASITRITIEE